jgi:phage terminase Nu1 subunit (DNA packaging protein)
MPIDHRTEITTAEMLSVLGLTKGRLSQLESAGTVKRVGRDRWNLAQAVQALLRQAQQRSDQVNDARLALDKVKHQREQLRLMRELKEVAPISDLHAFVEFQAGVLLPLLSAIPPRVAGRNLELKRHAEAVVRDVQQAIADACTKEAERIAGKEGKAA